MWNIKCMIVPATIGTIRIVTGFTETYQEHIQYIQYKRQLHLEHHI